MKSTAALCQCVKALVYYDAQMCHLDLLNEKGDTALHMAARWGYEGIIQVLLENGASTDVINKNKDSPLQCALNSKVSSRGGGLESALQFQYSVWRLFLETGREADLRSAEIMQLCVCVHVLSCRSSCCCRPHETTASAAAVDSM